MLFHNFWYIPYSSGVEILVEGKLCGTAKMYSREFLQNQEIAYDEFQVKVSRFRLQ